MRRFLFALALACLSLPLHAAQRTSLEDLERLLATTKAHSDNELARQLSGLELTERLTSVRLAQMIGALPGERSRQALVALADSSAFLNPPASEIPATATPDAGAQKRMMGLTVDYLARTLPLLPNFFAARDTVRFETKPGVGEAEELRTASRARVTVLYRNGREFVDAGQRKGDKPQAPDRGLTTWGEFGPIMGTVVVDAARSTLHWSHWELGAGGPEAVFSYAVPKERSHYDVRFCCTTAVYGMEINVLTQRTGYHGEIMVDPDSGAILRLTVIADLEAGNPIGRAALAVEYGPVELGGKTYYCPVHGVAIALAPDLKALSEALAPPRLQGENVTQPRIEKATLTALDHSPRQVLLNDVSFREFHLFRAEARVMAGEGDGQAGGTEAAPGKETSTGTETAAKAEAPAQGGIAIPNPDQAVDSSTLAAQPPPGNPVTEISALPAKAQEALAREPELPEVSVSAATGLPETPRRESVPGSTPVLRLTARLVDLPVVAVDKKGRPINNLKPEDFEIFDEGQKVQLRSFAQASAGTDTHAEAAQPAMQEHLYSNRRVPTAAAKTELPANTVVLLVDNNLSFADLSLAREQMEHFLQTMPQGDRVALYSMIAGGAFRVIEEGTADHQRVAAAVARFNPTAMNLAQGEEQENRNRQKIETVHNFEDLLTVNGHYEGDTGINMEALDMSLRELGDRPSANALDMLVDVARHLGSMPGHKSLVWIASDNVLADWTLMSVTVEKSSHSIDAAALRTQEAMNNAHVSVYPMDVSRLEGGITDASVSTRNVEINPTNRNRIAAGIPQVEHLEEAMHGPEFTAGADVNTNPERDLVPGRLVAQMQQDMKPIQGAFREIAEATGGKAFRRSSNIAGELDSVAADGRATYLLSFSPPQPADGKYHLITVKVLNRKDVTLRYRTGYLYKQESSTLRQRFADAVAQPQDAGEIGLTADPAPESNGRALRIHIAATDLEIAQKDALWTGKVDIFVAQRAVSSNRARVSGQTLALRLKPGTYQKFLKDGIPFNQPLEPAPGTGSLRIVVLDETSGRIGTLTVPAVALSAAR